LDRNSIPDYCCPFCDEAETGEEHGVADSESSNNNLTNFQPLQIPSTKSQVPHLTGSSPVTQSTSKRSCVKVDKPQGPVVPFWNVPEQTETEASQRKKARVNRHL
jgi:hypothetical protein